MVIVLADHIGQHPFRLLLIDGTAEPTPAPGYFLPDEDTQAVAEMKDDWRLLIVRQTDIVDAHFFHLDHLATHPFFSHRCSQTGMVLMTMRTPDEQTFTVEQERTMVGKCEVAETYLHRLLTRSPISPRYRNI